jgi:hypothetical protein
MTRGVIGGVYNIIKICSMDYENYDIKKLMRETVLYGKFEIETLDSNGI